jgi:hypothetical protein
MTMSRHKRYSHWNEGAEPFGGTIRPLRHDHRPVTKGIGARGMVARTRTSRPGQAHRNEGPDVRNRPARLVTLLFVVAALVAACSGTAAAPDPYDQLTTSGKATWDPIQVNVGVKVTAGGHTVTLDPKDIALVVDSAAEKLALHISLPASRLEIPAAALDQLGIDGDSLDFDVVYAGDAMYGRSTFFRPMLQMILGPTGKVPAGDLSGWLKFGTKEELAALQAIGGGAAGMPSFAPPSNGVAATRASFEAAGITLTSAANEKHNGIDAQHIKIAVDLTKLTSNPDFIAGAGPQSGQMIAMMKALSFSGDLWLDPATNRVIEADGHVASTNDPAAVGDVTVTAHDPDGSVSLDPPTSSVDVPLGTLITEMMKLLGKGAES